MLLLSSALTLLLAGTAHAGKQPHIDIHADLRGSADRWRSTVLTADARPQVGLGMGGDLGAYAAYPVSRQIALGLGVQGAITQIGVRPAGQSKYAQQNLKAVDALFVIVGSTPGRFAVLHQQLGGGLTLGQGWTRMLDDDTETDPETTGLRGVCIDYAAHLNLSDAFSDGAWSRQGHQWTWGINAGVGVRVLTPQNLPDYTPGNTWGTVPGVYAKLGVGTHFGGPPSLSERRRQQNQAKKKKQRKPKERKNTGPGRR